MNEKAKPYHFIIDGQNIVPLKKMVNEVLRDSNCWIDITFMNRSKELGDFLSTALEFAEMLWDKDISRAVLASTVKYQAQLLEK
ncbi:MAG: hypothetical protein WAV05_10200 [Anaerolineales bacterium]